MALVPVISISSISGDRSLLGSALTSGSSRLPVTGKRVTLEFGGAISFIGQCDNPGFERSTYRRGVCFLRVRGFDLFY